MVAQEIKIQRFKIKDLKPAEYNPRQSTQKQEDQLRKSLNKFGCVEPIIVNINNNRKNIIVGGHFRLRELKKLGYKEVDCIIVDLDIKDEKELNIRLNKNIGEFDFDMLANNFEELDLIEWGFDEIELGMADVAEEEAKENIEKDTKILKFELSENDYINAESKLKMINKDITKAFIQLIKETDKWRK